jgi:cell wall assembly regulator SMI1
MKRKFKILILASSILVVLLAIGVLLVPRSIRNFFYPAAPQMPPEVGQNIDEILTKLEGTLQKKAPHFLAELKQGLSDAEITALENKSGIRLPDDVKALYRWHNGGATRNPLNCGPIPGHRFVPLDEALGANNTISNQAAQATGAQRAAFEIFAGHTKSWIPLFDDGAGDGYFFDPKRKSSEGAVFYHFAETASYIFFPSVKNLMAGTVKCYEQNAFAWKTNGSASSLTEDFERSQKIWEEFGSSNPQ